MSITDKLLMSLAIKRVRGKLNKFLTGETMWKSKAVWVAIVTGVLFTIEQVVPFMSAEVQKVVLGIAGMLEAIFLRGGIQKAINGKK